MKNKHELTEKLKILETDIYDSKIELKAINDKIEYSQQYEDELIQRLRLSQNKNTKLKEEFFKKSSEITIHYNKMTDIFNIFTANFYRNVE